MGNRACARARPVFALLHHLSCAFITAPVKHDIIPEVAGTVQRDCLNDI